MTTAPDRLNPAADCRILPCPRPRTVGLNMAQLKAGRTLITASKCVDDTHFMNGYVGVLKVHMVGGAQGIGMISTARSARSLSEPINPPRSAFWMQGVRPADVRPAGKRRSAKKPKENPCCVNRIPTSREYDNMDYRRRMNRLTQWYKLIARGKGSVSLENSYENMRESFICKYQHRGTAELDRMEQTIRENTGK